MKLKLRRDLAKKEKENNKLKQVVSKHEDLLNNCEDLLKKAEELLKKAKKERDDVKESSVQSRLNESKERKALNEHNESLQKELQSKTIAVKYIEKNIKMKEKTLEE